MKKAVVLFSGGLDSTTCLAIARDQGFIPYALSFDYGQRHRAELQAAHRITQHLGIQHETVQLSIGHLGGSALTDSSIDIPDYQPSDDIPVTYVPARNTTFLSIALGWAEILDAEAIFIGVSSIDYSGYPDCRPEYIQAFQTMANLATKNGVEGRSINIHTPLIELSKAQTIQTGTDLGVDYAMTVSCYQANDLGEACGVCDSCYLRQQGFLAAGISDPTRYTHSQSA